MPEAIKTGEELAISVEVKKFRPPGRRGSSPGLSKPARVNFAGQSDPLAGRLQKNFSASRRKAENYSDRAAAGDDDL